MTAIARAVAWPSVEADFWCSFDHATHRVPAARNQWVPNARRRLQHPGGNSGHDDAAAGDDWRSIAVQPDPRRNRTTSFTLGDLNIDYDFGPAVLTPISSYTTAKSRFFATPPLAHRQRRVRRRGTDAEVRISSPLYDRTKLEVAQPGVAPVRRHGELPVAVGGFYLGRGSPAMAESSPTPGYDATTLRFSTAGTSADLNAPPDTPQYGSNLTHSQPACALLR